MSRRRERTLPRALLAQSAALALGALAACGGAPPLPDGAERASAAAREADQASEAAPSSLHPVLSEAALREHLGVLTDDALAGRQAGSEGERAAARYVAQVLERAGVGPTPSLGRFQDFDASQGWEPAASPRSLSVLGWLPGTDAARAGELVVLGAHLDHLGAPNGVIHPGADDDASGVAVVLEVARALSARRSELGRPVVFAFFGAEELGLLGARAFVGEKAPKASAPSQPAFADPASIAVMVNVDMVGRTLFDFVGTVMVMRFLGIDPDASLGVIGMAPRPQLRAAAERAFAREGITLVGADDLPGVLQGLVEQQSNGRADSFAFERAGVPTLFFTNGVHVDYHQPSDTVDRLRVDLMAKRGRAIAELVVALSTMPKSQLPRSTGSPFAVKQGP